jgi:hypothetical protein
LPFQKYKMINAWFCFCYFDILATTSSLAGQHIISEKSCSQLSLTVNVSLFKFSHRIKLHDIWLSRIYLIFVNTTTKNLYFLDILHLKYRYYFYSIIYHDMGFGLLYSNNSWYIFALVKSIVKKLCIMQKWESSIIFQMQWALMASRRHKNVIQRL